MHTCDKRHPKSWIAERCPSFAFDEGFTEEASFLFRDAESRQSTPFQDELWTPDNQESEEHVDTRVLSTFEHIWAIYPEDSCRRGQRCPLNMHQLVFRYFHYCSHWFHPWIIACNLQRELRFVDRRYVHPPQDISL